MSPVETVLGAVARLCSAPYRVERDAPPEKFLIHPSSNQTDYMSFKLLIQLAADFPASTIISGAARASNKARVFFAWRTFLDPLLSAYRAT